MARVPYAEQGDLPEEYRDLVISSLQGKPVHVYQAVGNNPPVLKGLRDYLGSLWGDTGLSDYRRELAILATASGVGSAYEWHQHVNIASGEGVTAEEMRAIADGRFDAFEAPEAALLRYVAAVVDGDVDDETHDALREHFPDDSTVVGITALVGGYLCLARLLSAFEVEIEDEFVGWHPEDV